ncbi:hypothetical protein NMG60_11033213 [Bertholletia excelsa]
MASLADLAIRETPKTPWVSFWQRKKRLNGQQKKEELEREVAMLRKMLDHEQKVQEILDQAHRQQYRSAFSIPNFLPPKAKELLAELAMVESEIVRLETQIGQLQTDLNLEREVSKEYKLKQLKQQASFTLNKPRSNTPFPSNHSNIMSKVAAERTPMPFETKALHFISKAIKGDYTLNDFSVNMEKPRKSVVFVDHKENNFREVDVIGVQEKASKKSGVLKPPSPMRETRYQTPKKERNVEVPQEFPAKYVSTPLHTDEENIQKWPPNKLAENIMKCLIFIFVRLLRTSRTLELEKSGPIFRSVTFSSSSRSFRVDTSSNSKAALLQRDQSKQQDPYGIFDIEESIPRDIGPYKNLVMFTASNLDPKLISNSSSIPLLQRLRVLLNSLQKVDLRLLTYQQKLAFWINMYNACIMHGFLQYGVPSSPEKFLTLLNKATINVGGNTINSHTIERFILRKPATSMLKEKGGNEDKEAAVRELYGLESSDANVTFALCCGTRSSPAVKIYTAENVVVELERSKLEYLQASIVVTGTKKIALPELLLRNMHDFVQDVDSLVEWVCHQLPTSGTLRKSMVDCFRGLNNGKVSGIVEKIPYDFEFQYLLSV